MGEVLGKVFKQSAFDGASTNDAIMVLGKEKFDIFQQLFGKDPVFGNIISTLASFMGKSNVAFGLGGGADLLPQSTPVLPQGIGGQKTVYEKPVVPPVATTKTQ